MEKIKRRYNLVSFILFLITVIVLATIDKTSNIKLSLIIRIIMIVYLIKITWGCIIYVKGQYEKHKYSYAIVMNLGLVLFFVINIFRQIKLLITNWGLTSINDIYINTLNSFSYFSLFIMPLIVILAGYSIFTNIFLIIKEGFKLTNLLGIVFGIIIAVGIFVSQAIFEIIKQVELINSQIYIKKFIDIGLNSVLCYFYCLTLATLYCNIMASIHKPKYDKDFVIILGARVREDGTLTPLLKARVDKAIEFSKNQKENTNRKIVFVPSGGKGEDEIISEAEAMQNYLIQSGIDKDDIMVENKSTNTVQNLKFSKEKIDEKNKNGNIIFSTTNYHVFRSGVIANYEGIDCEGIGSNTKWYFYANAMIREFFANLVLQRKEHFAIITLINFFILILVIVGYKYNLIV